MDKETLDYLQDRAAVARSHLQHLEKALQELNSKLNDLEEVNA